MFCRFCGKEIADDSVFCQHCGVKLTDNADGKLVVDSNKAAMKEPADIAASGMQQQLELQLHAEYASMNNAHFASVIALFATLMAVVGTYFYVYAKTVDFDVPANVKLLQAGNFFSYDHLLMVTIAAVFVLFLMGYVCVAMGFRQRKEQFIIYHIRKRYFDADSLTETFPADYHPFGKSKGEFLQGLFGASLIPVFCAIVAITVLTILKGSFFNMWIPVAVSAFLLCVLGYVKDRRYIDYKALETAYQNDKPEHCTEGTAAGLKGVYVWAKPKMKDAYARGKLLMRSCIAWIMYKGKVACSWLKPKVKAVLTKVMPKLKAAYVWVMSKLRCVYDWMMPKLKVAYAWLLPKLKWAYAWVTPRVKHAYEKTSEKLKAASKGMEETPKETPAADKEEPVEILEELPPKEHDTDESLPHD
ncbi:MAG: zinc ribbon domain-containing protein [Bacteroidaceae bacterium]|nr:zinc ribbon domain-containing protein [Bacteroidaceae bacterium]